MVYPIHIEIRNHTQFCLLRLFSSKLYMVVWDLCNTVIPYNEEHRIIRFMMININDVTYNNNNILITMITILLSNGTCNHNIEYTKYNKPQNIVREQLTPIVLFIFLEIIDFNIHSFTTNCVRKKII